MFRKHMSHALLASALILSANPGLRAEDAAMAGMGVAFLAEPTDPGDTTLKKMVDLLLDVIREAERSTSNIHGLQSLIGDHDRLCRDRLLEVDSKLATLSKNSMDVGALYQAQILRAFTQIQIVNAEGIAALQKFVDENEAEITAVNATLRDLDPATSNLSAVEIGAKDKINAIHERTRRAETTLQAHFAAAAPIQAAFDQVIADLDEWYLQQATAAAEATLPGYYDGLGLFGY